MGANGGDWNPQTLVAAPFTGIGIQSVDLNTAGSNPSATLNSNLHHFRSYKSFSRETGWLADDLDRGGLVLMACVPVAVPS
jgi:hypothetical protein